MKAQDRKGERNGKRKTTRKEDKVIRKKNMKTEIENKRLKKGKSNEKTSK